MLTVFSKWVPKHAPTPICHSGTGTEKNNFGHEYKRTNNPTSKLYIRLSCKSWRHGKSKANMVACYIVLLKAE